MNSNFRDILKAARKSEQQRRSLNFNSACKSNFSRTSYFSPGNNNDSVDFNEVSEFSSLPADNINRFRSATSAAGSIGGTSDSQKKQNKTHPFTFGTLNSNTNLTDYDSVQVISPKMKTGSSRKRNISLAQTEF